VRLANSVNLQGVGRCKSTKAPGTRKYLEISESISFAIGCDVVAYNPTVEQRYGITVKARTRMPRTEAESVYVFRHEDRKKMLSACKAFGCEPWIAIYVESECAADLYLTSLANYDSEYRVRGRKTESWKMTSKQLRGYTADAEVKHIHVVFSDENWWVIKLKAQRTRKERAGIP
jgi:Holliday junction resolvase